LSTAGFRIPAGFAITTDALDHFLASNGLTDEIASALKRFDELRFVELGNEPAHLRKRLTGGDLPEDLGDELRRTLGELGDGPVALRSSSTLEDRADFSFAGQHDSCLNLQDFDECAAALKTVWASLYSDRAISYLRALDRSTQPLRMGVVLQKLVHAQSAGVAFTVHPVSGNYEQVYISAALGLYESTLSGEVTPDEILVSRTERKTLRYTVGADDQQAQALDETQVAQIAELALNVEEQIGNNPQDVEWAYRDGELFLLQARPMVETAEQGINWQAPISVSH
jgi:phosphoenolpyruvate synthase/pyruvate phosphate dikinase